MDMVEALPSTWDRATIGQVSRLYVDAWVDQAIAQQALVDVMAATRQKMALAFVEEARALAVEVRPEDLAFAEQKEDAVPHRVRLRAHWSPSTREVEMRGGHVDGEVLEVQRPGDPLNVSLPPSSLWWKEEPEPAVLTPNYRTYELSGWSESSHRWVYTLRA